MFPYDKFSETQEVFWTKNGVKIDFRESGKKYSGFNIEDQSLTIHNVNHRDAGSYQITVINSIGSTSSDIIVIGNNLLVTQLIFDLINVVASE